MLLRLASVTAARRAVKQTMRSLRRETVDLALDGETRSKNLRLLSAQHAASKIGPPLDWPRTGAQATISASYLRARILSPRVFAALSH
jgi:hypothetical protein